MSIFMKIIAGELPSYKIYEDEFTYAFLSIDPIRPGHTLIVPKRDVDHFFDVTDPHYTQVFTNARVLGRAIKEATGCQRVGMAVQGFEVNHFHLHLIPLESPADFDFKKAKRASSEELAESQKKILARVKS